MIVHLQVAAKALVFRPLLLAQNPYLNQVFDHSFRSVLAGFSRAMRHAGSTLAAVATNSNRHSTAANVHASVGLTPQIRCRMSRTTPKASIHPNTQPMAAKATPGIVTSEMACPVVAPIAMRI